MSAPVDVLMVMESDAHCAAESRARHYDAVIVEATRTNSDAALAAVAELIEDRKRLELLTEKGWAVRRMQDTGRYMLVDGDGFPITGGEHETSRAAIDGWLALTHGEAAK